MSINFFESVQHQTRLYGNVTPDLVHKYDQDNEYLVYIYSRFSEKLLDLLKEENNSN